MPPSVVPSTTQLLIAGFAIWLCWRVAGGANSRLSTLVPFGFTMPSERVMIYMLMAAVLLSRYFLGRSPARGLPTRGAGAATCTEPKYWAPRSDPLHISVLTTDGDSFSFEDFFSPAAALVPGIGRLAPPWQDPGMKKAATLASMTINIAEEVVTARYQGGREEQLRVPRREMRSLLGRAWDDEQHAASHKSLLCDFLGRFVVNRLGFHFSDTQDLTSSTEEKADSLSLYG